MAAGIGSRYGAGIKQLAKMGPNGEIIMDYSIHDAKEAGFNKVVFIIRKDLEEEFKSTIGARVEKIAEVAYAYQEMEKLPEGFVKPADRTKPWGTGHADLISVQAMLKDAGFKVPEINMEAYMKVRSMIQEFMDDFLGLYISPKNRLMNSLLIAPGLPGGMMGSLMADLETNLESINKYKAVYDSG